MPRSLALKADQTVFFGAAKAVATIYLA